MQDRYSNNITVLDNNLSDKKSNISLEILHKFYDVLLLKHPGAPELYKKTLDYPEIPIFKICAGIMFLFSRSSKIIDKNLRPLVLELEGIRSKLNHRELLYLDILNDFLKQDYKNILGHLDKVFKEYPKDVLIVVLLNFYNLSRGDIKGGVTLLEKYKNKHKDDIDYLIYYLLYYSVSSGSSKSEDKLINDLWNKINKAKPQEAFTHHLGAHVITMRHSLSEAIEYLESVSPQWEKASPYISTHNWLHLGLLYVWNYDDNNKNSKSLEIFKNQVWNDNKEDVFTQMNGVLYLWYLDLAGFDVKDQWIDVARSIKQVGGYKDNLSSYIKVIFSYALLKGGFIDLGEEIIQSIKSHGDNIKEKSWHDVWVKEAYPLALGCQYYALGDYEKAADILKEVSDDAHTELLGNSDEQRFMFYQTYWLSLIKSGQKDKAHEIIKDFRKGEDMWFIEKKWLGLN